MTERDVADTKQSASEMSRNDTDQSGSATDQPDWFKERQEYNRHALEHGWPYWRVVLRLDVRDGEQIYGDHAPHRAAAKKRVRKLLDDDCTVTEWVDTYIPRPSWDCPNCRTHECMSTVPNMRGKWDWECMCCRYRTVGHPQDPEEEAGRGSDRI